MNSWDTHTEFKSIQSFN